MASTRHGSQRREVLLDRLAHDRLTLLDALERRGWERPAANGWTGKDYLAHVATWARRVVGWFEEDAAGQPVHRPEPGYSFEQIDALNERDRFGVRDRPLDEVRREFEDAHAAVVRLVEGMTDDDLNAADRFAWLGFPAKDAIAGNSLGHYLEHAAMLDDPHA